MKTPKGVNIDSLPEYPRLTPERRRELMAGLSHDMMVEDMEYAIGILYDNAAWQKEVAGKYPNNRLTVDCKTAELRTLRVIARMESNVEKLKQKGE